VSEISDERIATPGDVLSVGDKVQARIIGINEDKRQVRLTMRSLFGPPEIPAISFEERDRDRPATGRGAAAGGKGKRKERGGRKERVDRRFLDDAGHESLSMRDLLGEANIDDNE
jgi:predicted RNA-binding protein with RPS1 domain